MTSGAIGKRFRPAWWLPDGHSQTLWRKISPPDSIEQTRQRIELKDGDFIDLDWASISGQIDSENKPIVLILHGLCGCSSSPYIVALQTVLAANNILSAAINFRGCSGEINRLAKAYHSGISEDINEVFAEMLKLHPENNFVFVGFSLGANVLLKYLGECQGHSRIKKAVAISTPFSLSYCSKAMLKGISQFYGKYFVWRLLKEIELKKQHFESIGDSEQQLCLSELGDLTNISSIWEFDEQVTAPLHGFRSAEDYYNQCSSLGYIDAITTDTLLIQSRNDPLIPAISIPGRELLGSNIDLLLCAKGGHVGFISGSRNNWLEHRILNFIEA